MNKILILIVCCMLSFKVPAQTVTPEKLKKVEEILFMQQQCWNNGDIECFMQYYWNSDSLMFIGKNGITYGWKNTLDNYQKRYPDKAAMGVLNFEIIKTSIITESDMHLIGKWLLTREKDSPGGYFTLLWKKINGEWKIIMDHSS